MRSRGEHLTTRRNLLFPQKVGFPRRLTLAAALSGPGFSQGSPMSHFYLVKQDLLPTRDHPSGSLSSALPELS